MDLDNLIVKSDSGHQYEANADNEVLQHQPLTLFLAEDLFQVRGNEMAIIVTNSDAGKLEERRLQPEIAELVSKSYAAQYSLQGNWVFQFGILLCLGKNVSHWLSRQREAASETASNNGKSMMKPGGLPLQIMDLTSFYRLISPEFMKELQKATEDLLNTANQIATRLANNEACDYLSGLERIVIVNSQNFAPRARLTKTGKVTTTTTPRQPTYSDFVLVLSLREFTEADGKASSRLTDDNVVIHFHHRATEWSAKSSHAVRGSTGLTSALNRTDHTKQHGKVIRTLFPFRLTLKEFDVLVHSKQIASVKQHLWDRQLTPELLQRWYSFPTARSIQELQDLYQPKQPRLTEYHPTSGPAGSAGSSQEVPADRLG